MTQVHFTLNLEEIQNLIDIGKCQIIVGFPLPYLLLIL